MMDDSRSFHRSADAFRGDADADESIESGFASGHLPIHHQGHGGASGGPPPHKKHRVNEFDFTPLQLLGTEGRSGLPQHAQTGDIDSKIGSTRNEKGIGKSHGVNTATFDEFPSSDTTGVHDWPLRHEPGPSGVPVPPGGSLNPSFLPNPAFGFSGALPWIVPFSNANTSDSGLTDPLSTHPVLTPSHAPQQQQQMHQQQMQEFRNTLLQGPDIFDDDGGSSTIPPDTNAQRFQRNVPPKQHSSSMDGLSVLDMSDVGGNQQKNVNTASEEKTFASPPGPLSLSHAVAPFGPHQTLLRPTNQWIQQNAPDATARHQGSVDSTLLLSAQRNQMLLPPFGGIGPLSVDLTFPFTSGPMSPQRRSTFPPQNVQQNLEQQQQQRFVGPPLLPSMTTMAPRPRGIPLSLSCDSEQLSEYQILVRQQLELFEATADDIQSNTQGRKKQITLGQVGIRCMHCTAHPWRQRGKGAVYYPTKLQGVYQAAQNMAGSHLCESCQAIPPALKNLIRTLRERRDSASGGKQYWADGCRAIGLYETERSGLRFRRREREPSGNSA